MKTSTSNIIKVFILSAISGIWFTGCGDNSSDSGEAEFTVQTVATESHGNILTDGEGNSLYFFTSDVKGESTCEGECVANWPAFNAGQIMPGEGLEASDFGSITRPDGGSQTTYKGWPLYYFISDEQPGDYNGDGVQGVWYVAKPDNSMMIATQQLVGADGENYIIDENGDYVQGEGTTTYFTDSRGRTLYVFVNDMANTNNCTGGCIDAWPVFHSDIESLPSGMNADDFGEITAHGDRPQLTCRGWPVYYFAQDTERGDTKGVSVPQPGVWPILNSNTPDAPEQ